MQLVLLADETMKEEVLKSTVETGLDITWIKDENEFLAHNSAESFLDLDFSGTEQRVKILESLLPKPVIINSVSLSLEKLKKPFVRMNAWPGFFARTVVEASFVNKDSKAAAEQIFLLFNKTIKWVPDEPGFITARVIASIINEAYFAVEEGVSTKEEIDVAMKLGTNYPLGPFEWSEKIGLKKIYSLLIELSKTSLRYKPAPLLEKEATV